MSDHWYKRDGSPCYELPTKDGGMRGVSLRWDRHLGLVPSVTSVLQVIDKPALTNWRVEQGILAALTLPRREDESEPDFLRRVMDDSKRQAKDAADLGTLIHDACESHWKRRPYTPTFQPHVHAVVAEVGRLFPAVTDWVAEAYFAHEDGYGGKVDLHSPSTGIVIDYKGKDGDFSDAKRLAYDQHWQLAGYQRGLRLPAAPCANIFFSRTHPGKVTSHVWRETDIADGWAVFSSALALWRAIKKYDPRFAREAVA